jgi:hypothetical protein
MEPMTLALLGLAGGITAMAGAASGPAPKKTKHVRKREPIPVAPPKPITPPLRRYGASRRLIEAQRAWMAAETPQPSVAGPSVHDESGRAAFSYWFEQSFLIPEKPTADDVIPFEAWARSYVDYCNAHGYPKLTDQELFALIGEGANLNHCSVSEFGEFIGARLKD